MIDENKDQQPSPSDIPTGNPGTDNSQAPKPQDIDTVPVEMGNGKNEE